MTLTSLLSLPVTSVPVKVSFAGKIPRQGIAEAEITQLTHLRRRYLGIVAGADVLAPRASSNVSVPP